MITLLTYLYYTLWEVETYKEIWAYISATEVAIELSALILYICLEEPWRK